MRILLVKTGSLPHAAAVLSDLVARFPEARLTVLTEQREFETFMSDRRVADVWFYVNLWGFPGLLLKTWRRGFALKALLFTQEASYEKFKLLGLFLPAKQSLTFTPGGGSLVWSFRDWQTVRPFARQFLLWVLAPFRFQSPTLPRPWRGLMRLARLALSALVFPCTLLYLALYAFWTLRRFPRSKEGVS